MIGRQNSELAQGAKYLRPALMMVTAILAVLAVACSLLVWRYQQDLAEASRYNATFDLSQGASELLRLQVAIEDSRRGLASNQLALRYGIIRNRVGIIAANMGLSESDRLELFGPLQAVLDRIGPNLDRIARNEGADEASDLLRPFVSRFLQAASRSHASNGDAVLQRQQQLRNMLLGISAITLALVLFGALLVSLILRQYKRLHGVARTDTLTGLLNRLAFNTLLREIGQPQRAIVLVDVDHFKSLNDTLGHEAGDRLLCAVADRLRSAAQGSATVARIGGDEFAALFSGLHSRTESVAFAARVQEEMKAPIMINGRQVSASVTQGVRVATYVDGLSLFNDADIALYAAKKAGRGGHLVFDPAMKQDFLRRQKLLGDMRRMSAGDTFFLVFQPIVDLREEDRLRGFEALMRWQHPELGLVSPAEFIPLAEEGGMILDLGKLVIAEACRQAATWPEDMFVAVNVSARQLMDVTLVSHVAACLSANGIAGTRLEIEITESTLIENDAKVLEVLGRLQALGCRISLDDFGTGYASLSYLRRFRFDKLKIDQSFVRVSGGEGLAIVATICLLADRLGLTVVAEGIETLEQRDSVRKAGSQLGQGYLFSRPLPSDALQEFIDRQNGIGRLVGAA